jgi:hypothetical protein
MKRLPVLVAVNMLLYIKLKFESVFIEIRSAAEPYEVMLLPIIVLFLARAFKTIP